MAPRHGQPPGSAGTGLPREAGPGRQAWAGLAPHSQGYLPSLTLSLWTKIPQKGRPQGQGPVINQFQGLVRHRVPGEGSRLWEEGKEARAEASLGAQRRLG